MKATMQNAATSYTAWPKRVEKAEREKHDRLTEKSNHDDGRAAAAEHAIAHRAERQTTANPGDRDAPRR